MKQKMGGSLAPKFSTLPSMNSLKAQFIHTACGETCTDILAKWTHLPNNLFVATHSPYILNAFIEKQDIDIALLYTRTTGGLTTVKTATDQDVQDIYDYGVDAFFNIETLG